MKMNDTKSHGLNSVISMLDHYLSNHWKTEPSFICFMPIIVQGRIRTVQLFPTLPGGFFISTTQISYYPLWW